MCPFEGNPLDIFSPAKPTEEIIEDGLREVSESFIRDASKFYRLQENIYKYPNIPSQEVWKILPVLFIQGVLDASELRSMDYSQFLQTPYWRAVSWYVKENYPKCEICITSSVGPLEVHHRTYAHRGDEWRHLDDLMVLCRTCHEKQHTESEK